MLRDDKDGWQFFRAATAWVIFSALMIMLLYFGLEIWAVW